MWQEPVQISSVPAALLILPGPLMLWLVWWGQTASLARLEDPQGIVPRGEKETLVPSWARYESTASCHRTETPPLILKHSHERQQQRARAVKRYRTTTRFVYVWSAPHNLLIHQGERCLPAPAPLPPGPAASHVTSAHLFHWCLSKPAGAPWRIRKKFCSVYVMPNALQYSNVSNFLF